MTWAIMLAILVAGAGAVMPQFQARPGAIIAVVFPPWWSSETAFRASARAGVAIVAPGRMPNVMMVSANSVEALVRLYRAGAWSLLGTDGAAGCFAPANTRPIQKARES